MQEFVYNKLFNNINSYIHRHLLGTRLNGINIRISMSRFIFKLVFLIIRYFVWLTGKIG